MRHNTHDKTLYRNYVRKWKFLIQEYELVKQKRHPSSALWPTFTGFIRPTGRPSSSITTGSARAEPSTPLVPQPAARSGKVGGSTGILSSKCSSSGGWASIVMRFASSWLPTEAPDAVTEYGVSDYETARAESLNAQAETGETPHREAESRGIRASGLPHLSKDLIATDPTRYYLVCVLDACTRLAWAEVVTDLKSLTVMFSALKSFNLLHQRYQLQFAEVLTDNGSEFAAPRTKDTHPFERMLLELGIKHRYTRPYRPQTNGKVERFWRT